LVSLLPVAAPASARGFARRSHCASPSRHLSLRDDVAVSSFPIPGVRAGHAGGVTAVLFPEGSVAAAELRGGAPATREIDLLDPARTVARVDAVVFAGGSAFGLAAADGVMRYLAERGQGYPTAGGPVPIVPTACIFDLADSAGNRPNADDGYAAAVAAARDHVLEHGRVGAGSNATVGKWRGREGAARGGVGTASAQSDGATVAALAVVNAVGDIVAADGSVVAGSSAPADAPPFPTDAPFEERANTTLVVLVTDASCDKAACFLLAQSAHDGFARAIRPAHTRFDGDLAIAVATGVVEASVDRLRVAAADVVADAIRDCAS
jgi:L-aminopeptidase/D-esterase-like protein